MSSSTPPLLALCALLTACVGGGDKGADDAASAGADSGEAGGESGGGDSGESPCVASYELVELEVSDTYAVDWSSLSTSPWDDAVDPLEAVRLVVTLFDLERADFIARACTGTLHQSDLTYFEEVDLEDQSNTSWGIPDGTVESGVLGFTLSDADEVLMGAVAGWVSSAGTTSQADITDDSVEVSEDYPR